MIQLSENIKLFTTDESRIEGSALQQLRKTAELPGVVQVAAIVITSYSIHYTKLYEGKKIIMF